MKRLGLVLVLVGGLLAGCSDSADSDAGGSSNTAGSGTAGSSAAGASGSGTGGTTGVAGAGGTETGGAGGAAAAPLAPTLTELMQMTGALHVMWTNNDSGCDSIEGERKSPTEDYKVVFTVPGEVDNKHDGTATEPVEYTYRLRCKKGE